MKDLDPELKTDILWILKALKKASFFASSEDAFPFSIEKQTTDGAPSTTTQSQILNYLVNQKVITYTLVWPRMYTTTAAESYSKTQPREVPFYSIKITQPNFDRLFKKLSNMEVAEDTQPPELAEMQKPFCRVESGYGYLYWGTSKTKIRISRTESQSFRLLQCLMEPTLGIRKNVDAIYESIRETVRGRYKTNSSVTSREEKIKRIEGAYKELQRGKKIEGLLKLRLDEQRRIAWFEDIS